MFIGHRAKRASVIKPVKWLGISATLALLLAVPWLWYSFSRAFERLATLSGHLLAIDRVYRMRRC